MKTRLNITIEDDLLKLAKRYAEKNNTSLSQLIEGYLAILTRPVRKGNIIQLIDKLHTHQLDLSKDLKKAYYEDQKEQHGF